MTENTQDGQNPKTSNVIDFRDYIVGFKIVKRHSYYDFRADNVPGGAVIDLQNHAS